MMPCKCVINIFQCGADVQMYVIFDVAWPRHNQITKFVLVLLTIVKAIAETFLPFEGTPAPVPKNTNSTFFPPALNILYLSSYGMLFQMAN